ncbi:ferric reductase NAD binding domain-containing protein [Xylariales sp. PMI_506]|nr:ferric reductase NAD binding domain-containing protein [Xylariales sp. PMI_506]
MSSTPPPSGAGGGSSGGGRPGQAPGGGDPAAFEMVENRHILLANCLLIACGVAAAAVIAKRVAGRAIKHERLLVGLSNGTQKYFLQTSHATLFLKKHILYAPLFSKRRSRLFQPNSAIKLGALPTRLQFFSLVIYVALNAAFCVVGISFSSFAVYGTMLRDRTGNLAVANMIPLFVLAARNNPLIRWLGVSFDTFNLMHRWVGRIIIAEAFCHAVTQLAMMASRGSWSSAFQTASEVVFMKWGLIASSLFRRGHYELFKLFHVALVILAIVGLYYHLGLEGQIATRWLYAVMGLWVADNLLRFARILYHNMGRDNTNAVVEALPGETCRLTLFVSHHWNIKSGQHAYLYLPNISLWQSHPFSVVWADKVEDLAGDKLPAAENDTVTQYKTKISFAIRARTGMTRKLYDQALKVGGPLKTTCFVEGPYGGLHNLHSYGTVILFAGGIGITHQIPYVRDLLIGYAEGTVAVRKVVLVWVVQDYEHLEWASSWMAGILALEKRREVLKIMLFVTCPQSTKEIRSQSSTVHLLPGRPVVDTILTMEMEQQVGATAVSVCGPGSLSDEVRWAVRKNQDKGNIDFLEEAFSW